LKGGKQLLDSHHANPEDQFFSKQVENAPKQEHDFYWDQFWVVNSERQDAGSIPVSRLWQTARELTDEIAEQSAFVYIMRVLDAAYLQIIAEKNKAGSK
jgi:hypothetical protein